MAASPAIWTGAPQTTCFRQAAGGRRLRRRLRRAWLSRLAEREFKRRPYRGSTLLHNSLGQNFLLAKRNVLTCFFDFGPIASKKFCPRLLWSSVDPLYGLR